MRTVLILLSCIITFCLHAQEVKIGQACPDIEMTMSNYPVSRAGLSDFRGKLVVLDFWSTNCGSCIRAFPKMEFIQKRFGDSIQIILVNQQTKDSTDRFFAKRKKLIKPDLPFITGDTLLNRLFPHEGVPFHVWIDGSGVVRYTTDGYNTTEQNVCAFLQGEKVSLKKSVFTKTIESQMDDKWKGAVVYHSYLSHSIDSIRLMPRNNLPGFEEIYANAASILDLYKGAYNEAGKYNLHRPGRMQLLVRDSFPYLYPMDDNVYDAWKKQHAYNYHLLLPLDRKDEIFRIMKEDLGRYFNLDARIEKRKVSCQVLIRTDSKDHLRTRGGEKKDNFFAAGPKSTTYDPIRDSVRCLLNQPYEKLSSQMMSLVEHILNKPFVDETGYKGNIDIQFRGSTLDSVTLDGLRQELRPYGLDLVERQRTMDVLVIRERAIANVRTKD